MAYEVLARKWRPKVFEDLIGQESVSKTLRNAISQNRVAHAYLFSGLRGVGKTSAARLLARALRCEQRQGDGNPCNTCSSCTEILEGRSMDVLEIDGASNNGVDAIRELREQAQYMPTSGSTKVYIIDEVHMLSTSAFNALLKILEEPPAHLVFLFATTEPDSLPDTILSRIQRFDFKRIPSHTLMGHLKKIAEAENLSLDEQVYDLIAGASEGSMRDAQSMLDQLISYCGTSIRIDDAEEVLGLVGLSTVVNLLTVCIQKNVQEMLRLVKRLFDQGMDLERFLVKLMNVTRDSYFITAAGKESLEGVSEELKTLLTELASQQDRAQWRMMFQILTQAYDRLRTSPHPRMTLEMTLARLMDLAEVQSLDQILQKISSSPSPVTTKRTAPPSPPRSPAAPSVAPSTSADQTSKTNDGSWTSWLEFLRQQRPSLASAFEGAEARVQLPVIHVDLQKAQGASLLADPNMQRNLAPLSKTHFGVAVRWNFVGARKPQLSASKKEHEELLQDDRVKMAQKYLGAEVESVQVSSPQE